MTTIYNFLITVWAGLKLLATPPICFFWIIAVIPALAKAKRDHF